MPRLNAEQVEQIIATELPGYELDDSPAQAPSSMTDSVTVVSSDKLNEKFSRISGPQAIRDGKPATKSSAKPAAKPAAKAPKRSSKAKPTKSSKPSSVVRVKTTTKSGETRTIAAVVGSKGIRSIQG
jgi:hypothetical protein